MKNPVDDKSILIQNPYGDNDFEFELNRETNITLVLRKLRQRSKSLDLRNSVGKKLINLRKELNVDELDDRIKKIDTEKSLTKEEEEEVLKISDEYPKEVIRLQNQALSYGDEAFNIGIEICALVLKSKDPIPSDYDDNLDFMSNIITNDDEVGIIVNFFLESLDSTMNFHQANTVRIV